MAFPFPLELPKLCLTVKEKIMAMSNVFLNYRKRKYLRSLHYKWESIKRHKCR